VDAVNHCVVRARLLHTFCSWYVC